MRSMIRWMPLVLTTAVLGACASAPPYKPPEFLAEHFDARAVTRVAVLPVLDLRADRSLALELDAWTHRIARIHLKRRGYRPILYADRALIDSLQRLGQREFVAREIGNLRVPAADRRLLVFGLLDSYSKMTFGSTGNAEMVAYLIDQQTHQIVWHHHAVGQIGLAGPMGMMMKGLMERSGIEVATGTLIQSLPPRT